MHDMLPNVLNEGENVRWAGPESTGRIYAFDDEQKYESNLQK